MESIVKKRGKPNRGGGKFNRSRGRGRGLERGRSRGGGGRGGGWSASRKGGLDLDDLTDGPVLNNPFHDNGRKSGPGVVDRVNKTQTRSAGVKVTMEMQLLQMTPENQEMVKSTLLSLCSEDPESFFSYEDQDYVDEPDIEYDELDLQSENQDWLSDHTLVFQDALVNNISRSCQGAEGFSQENIFAMRKLQRCGFSTDICKEALQLCDGDVGSSLEYLLNDLFNISLSVDRDADLDDAKGKELPPEILEAREDEKLALQSIYDNAFEERIPNKTWVLNLELQELSHLINERTQSASKKSGAVEKQEQKVCPFFFKGSCKFKDKCRYSHAFHNHDTTASKKTKMLSHPLYANLNALEGEIKFSFCLEIRFPQGNKYPHEPPLVAFSSVIEELPNHTRLNITQFLMSLARDAAEDHQPCIFSLVSALEDKEKLEELLLLPSPTCNKPVSFTQSMGLDGTASTRSASKTAFLTDAVDVSKTSIHSADSVRQCRFEMKGERSRKIDKNDTYQSYVPPKRKDTMPARFNLIEIRKQNKTLQEEFKKKQSSKHYQNMMADRQRLPAWDMIGLVTEVIAENQVVVICGMTGCGKTTQVPQFLLDEALQRHDGTVNLICTQPRRISAVSVAQRVADERAEKLGRSVGYQIRLESVMSPFTRLLYCTTGIILRRLETDRTLEGVTHIIIDEVHERSEESDFLLMILKDVLNEREDLKVILMSATLNAHLFSQYFGGCPTLEIPGRTFPVQQLFLEDALEYCNYILEERSPYSRPQKRSSAAPQSDGKGATAKDFLIDALESDGSETTRDDSQVPKDRVPDMNLSPKQMKLRYSDYSNSTIKTLSAMDLEKINFDLIVQLLEWIVSGNHEFPVDGAILIFLPGFAEIQSLYDMLLSTAEFGIRNKARYKIIPMHSTLSSEDQSAVFMKPKEGVTKIVIATNIAETSITIDDIVYVIDAGRMKEKRYDQTKSMESLETMWVSRANAQQRMGRAGRVQEGVCFHLFTSHHYDFHLREQPIPEIQRACLEQLVLNIKMLPIFEEQKVENVLAKLIEPPCLEAINGAIKRLTDLGALDETGELTPLGYHVGSMPVDVRIGKLMLFGAIFRCLDSALTIAATLSFKSPFVTPFGSKQEADQKKKEFSTGNSDYLTMLNAYRGWCEARERGSHQAYLYCQENFLSIKTLQMLASLKQQYVELLSDIGFISSGIRLRDVERSAKGGSDGVAEVTGIEANVNSHNWKLISAMLVAALYPNIVQVLTPDTRYQATSGGSVMRDPTREELKFKTKSDGFVYIHPSSVNFQVGYYPSPYLVYHEKVKTSKVYIRDSSMVSVYPLLLFGGGSISLDLYQGNFILSVDDGWIQFKASSTQVAELIRELRRELDQLLSNKISQPDMDLLTCPRGSKIINCIVTLISSQ